MLQAVSDFGITLLLFTVGLKLRIGSRCAQLWGVAILHLVAVSIGLGAVMMLLAGSGLELLSGMARWQFLLLGFALSFSSTVFGMKCPSVRTPTQPAALMHETPENPARQGYATARAARRILKRIHPLMPRAPTPAPALWVNEQTGFLERAIVARSGYVKPDPFIIKRKHAMNWDRIEGNWRQLKGNVKQRWGKLTDDELDVIEGKRDTLTGKIQESYGISKDEAEKQVSAWQNRQKDLDR